MQQLRYLNLGHNYSMTRLPNWVVKLENLQTLDLSDCCNLKELPRDLKNMINLRHLMLRGYDSWTHMPCGLGELIRLRTLDKFVLSKQDSSKSRCSAGLGELKKLNELRGQFEIANLRHGKDVSESNVANIMNEKRHLASLTLQWSDEDEVNMDDEMSLEALQPHSNLKELVVFGYGGVKFASWLSLLKNIVNLKFDGLKRCQYLPPLDHLPFFKLLQLQGLDSLEYIADKGWGVSSPSEASSSTSTLPFFPSLDKLILEDCPNLKGWWRPTGRRDQHQSFPCLFTLEIRDCPSLTSMPLYPYLDKPLILKKTSFKPFQETMMMKKKNEDDNHMSRSAEHSTCSSLFLLLPCFSFRGASNVSSSSFSPLSKLKSLEIETFDKDIEGGVSEGIELGKLTSLESLSIGDSPNLASLPQGILGGLISLHELKIENCPNLASLPEAIGKLSSLQRLRIWSCSNLTSLPQGIGNLESLHLFEIAYCNNFTSFPESIGNLKSLETFRIQSLPNLISLPGGINNLTSLHLFAIDYCNNFTSFTESIGNLKLLEKFEIRSLPNLTSLPQGIGNLASLRQLEVYRCENLTSLPESIGNLKSLETFWIWHLDTLTSLPEGMCRLTSLNTLQIVWCSTLLGKRCKKETVEDWPKIAHIPNLLIYPTAPGVGGKILSAFKTLMHCN